MGQYFKGVLLCQNKGTVVSYAYSHDFGNGLKLMEHSYIGNCFVGVIEKHLAEKPSPLVWAGDYADEEPYDEYMGEEALNFYSLADEQFDAEKILYDEMPSQFLAKYKYNTNKEISSRYWGIMKDQMLSSDYKYLVNHDKKTFVDKSKAVEDEHGLAINPLPLLTAEGNGRGGGDFRGEDPKKLIGSWSRDIIQVMTSVPEGYEELIFDLVE